MALNTFNCDYLTPLHFKGLNIQRNISQLKVNRLGSRNCMIKAYRIYLATASVLDSVVAGIAHLMYVLLLLSSTAY